MVQIKIYPSKHKIELINESTFDTDLNIPLSYINLDYTKYDINKNINPDFLKSDTNQNIMMTPLIPGQLIEDIEKITFNKYEEEVSGKDLYKKQGSKYYYTAPYEFTPNKFSYAVTIKKNMVYKSSNKYNINIACIDNANDLELSSKLSKIFTNPQDRQLVPLNVSINHNKSNLSSLIDMSFDEADFVFMKTFNGYIIDSVSEEEAGINTFLDNNINVWVGCDDHYEYKITNDDLGYMTFNSVGAFTEFELKRSILSTNTLVTSNNYFNMNRKEFSSTTNKKFYNIFTKALSPVLIIEHVGRGFEIISHNEVLEDPEKHKNLIYEVMMYVYLLSYKRSKKVSEWITYTCPDYEVVNNKLYTKSNFSSHISLNELFDIQYGDYSIFQIDVYDDNDDLPLPDEDLITTVDNIEFVNVINNKMVFRMINKDNNSNIYTEVDKPVGWVSIYKDGKIYYIDQLLYYIESDITNKLFVVEKDNSLVIKLYPFKSSKYNINTKTDLTLTIKDIKTDVNGVMRVINEIYHIYYNKITNQLDYYLDEDAVITSTDIIKILELDIHQAIDNLFLTDMRQLGGGLINDAKNDYDLLDIGHINGRPYRQGNTLIITMPKKYESHKDKIKAVLDKYKVGEDYTIIFFEDKD